MKTLKVLHIMSGYGGGISSFIYNKAIEMPNFNIQFDVITYDNCPKGFIDVIESTGGTIYKMINPKKEGWNKFINSFKHPLVITNYDVIHCHLTGIKALPYYFMVKKYTSAKFYLHAHSTRIIENLSIKNKIQLRVHQFINSFISELPLGCGEKAIMSNYGISTPKEKIMVIPNSINVDEFARDTMQETIKIRKENRQLLNLKDSDLVIGHIGRLTNIKNHDLTLRLAQYMKKNSLNAKFLIIGDGYRRVELQETVKEKGLENYVVFTGRISPISGFYPTLDVLLLPSFSEGLPTVVVEAQIAGIPVVMSDSITSEVDLGFDMIESVSINEDISDWSKAIFNTQDINIPLTETRKKRAQIKKFSNENSAALYARFLQGAISNYMIN